MHGITRKEFTLLSKSIILLIFQLCVKVYLLIYDFSGLRIHQLPNHKDVWAVRGSCNPSFSTDNEESKVMYLVLETSTNKPVYSYCTCTVGYDIVF